jgi:ribose-phosphate pyrophosphokinase
MARIVAGSNSLELAEKISEMSGIPLIQKIVRKFPDGETYVRLEKTNFGGEKVFIIHSLYPEQNENLIELFLTADLVRENGGLPFLIIPYFAYGRQDKAFQKGEAFSLKTIAKILKSLGAEKLIIIDAHFHRKTGDFDFFGTPARNISAVTLQIEHAKRVIKGEFFVAGPDVGSKDFLSSIKNAVFLSKEKFCPVCRMPATKCKCKIKSKKYVIKTYVPKELENKNILLLDDMITTGSTIIESAKTLREKNNKVFVGCTHGLFVGDYLRELGKYAEYVFSSDTVKSGSTKISVAPLLAEELKKYV